MQILGVVGFKSSILTDYFLNTWFVHQNYPLQKEEEGGEEGVEASNSEHNIMLRFDYRSPTHKPGR